jgi:hypothetical protein
MEDYNMSKVGKIHSDYLRQTRVTFENIQNNAGIAAVLSGFGYGDVRIQEGLAIHGTAESVFRKLLDTRLRKRAASQDVRRVHNEAYAQYMGYVNRLRKELANDPPTREALGLEGIRGRTISKFIEEANHLYDTGLNDPEVAAVILPFGLTPELLQAALDSLVAYQTLRSNFTKLSGECQKLLVERDNAFKVLRRWMAALAAACRMAFADNLQTLEEVGIFVRNNPKSKSAGEPTEPPADPGTDPVPSP